MLEGSRQKEFIVRNGICFVLSVDCTFRNDFDRLLF